MRNSSRKSNKFRHRRRGVNLNKPENRDKVDNSRGTKHDLVFKQKGEEYCQVIKMLGDGRLEGLCGDG